MRVQVSSVEGDSRSRHLYGIGIGSKARSPGAPYRVNIPIRRQVAKAAIRAGVSICLLMSHGIRKRGERVHAQHEGREEICGSSCADAFTGKGLGRIRTTTLQAILLS